MQSLKLTGPLNGKESTFCRPLGSAAVDCSCHQGNIEIQTLPPQTEFLLNLTCLFLDLTIELDIISLHPLFEDVYRRNGVEVQTCRLSRLSKSNRAEKHPRRRRLGHRALPAPPAVEFSAGIVIHGGILGNVLPQQVTSDDLQE